MIKKNWFLIILFLLLCGIIDSVYLVHHHYWVNIIHPEAKSFCSVNEVLDCDEVALSSYAMIGQFPVATLGVFAYSVLFILLLLAKIIDSKRVKHYLSFSFLMIFLMFLFSLYEAAASILVIGKICIMCSILYTCVIGLIISHWIALVEPLKKVLSNIGYFFKESVIYTDRRFVMVGVLSLMMGYFVAIGVDFHFRTEFIKQKLVELQQKENLSQSGFDFLAQNKNQPGVVTLPSGLQYKIMKQGSGKQPTADDYVYVRYIGRLTDGTEISNTYQDKQASLIDLTAVIKGWKEGIPLMKEGGKWRFYLPPELAYGNRSVGKQIPKNATLIFDIELISIDQ
jgi:FKBP-type peptidyl-prolyl cis-trans isomerase FklB